MDRATHEDYGRLRLPLPSRAKPSPPETAAPHAGEIEYGFITIPCNNSRWRHGDRQGFRTHARLLDEFREDRRPQPLRLASLAHLPPEAGYNEMHLSPDSKATPPTIRRSASSSMAFGMALDSRSDYIYQQDSTVLLGGPLFP